MPNPAQRSKSAAISQLALAGYWLLLLVATHLPPSTSFLPRQGVDKIVHFFAFAVLATLVATTWQLMAGYLTTRHLCWAVVAIAAYGAVDELTQILVDRQCSFWDWLADTMGVVSGLLLFVWLRRIATSRKTRHD